VILSVIDIRISVVEPVPAADLAGVTGGSTGPRAPPVA
jgi:hypothetical protein